METTKYIIIRYKEIKNIDSIKVIGGFNDKDDALDYIRAYNGKDGFTLEVFEKL